MKLTDFKAITFDCYGTFVFNSMADLVKAHKQEMGCGS